MSDPRKEILADGVELWCGDCREILPTVSGFDACITDPPYRVTSGGFGNLEGGFGGWIKDAYDNKGAIVACDIEWHEWLSLVPQSMNNDSHIYIFSNDRNLNVAREAAEQSGLSFHRLLIWDKRAALPNRWYQQTCEFILFMRKGKARMINDPSSKSLVSLFQRDESCHPTEKPVQLCELYIKNSAPAGSKVLDPFMGSGTTGVAAVKLGRKFTGIELEPKYFDIACRRISEALKQPDFFVEPPKPAKQEAFEL